MKKTFILLFGILTAFTAVCQVPAINDIVRTNTLSPTRVANALDAGTAFTAAGTDTYTVAVGLGVYSGSMTYEEGDKFTILFTNANTGTSPTININSEGAKDIVDNKGSPVAVGDVEGILNLWYDGTDFRIVGAAGGGGSGTPGGSDTQVQYNDAGSFGGEADMTYDETTNTLTVDNVAVDTEVYDATGWDGNLTVPTKDALRDKIETLGAGSVLSVSGTTNRVTSTGGSTPVIDISGSYVGQSSITTTGTLTSGATGSGFTVALSTSTLTGDVPAANQFEFLPVACSDEGTVIVAGTNKVTFRMPRAATLTAVRASLNVAQTGGSIFTVDVHESGTTILSTKLTFDNNEATTTTAATAAVISDSTLADDAVITIDVDQVGTGSPTGLKVTFYWQ